MKQSKLSPSLISLFVLFAAVMMLLCGAAYGQTLTVKGPSETLAGDLVILTTDVEGLIGCTWIVIPVDITEGKYHVCDDGKTLVFASRMPGTYHFILAANDGTGVQQVMHKLNNKELNPPPPTPDPTPTPEPPPAPEPAPLPDPNYTALGEWAATKAKELVKSQYFDKEKKALGESFLSTAKLIEDGSLTTVESARVKQRDNARKYLASVSGSSATNWDSWNLELAKKLTEYDLEDVTKIGKAYQAIGITLNATGYSCESGNCPVPSRRR